MNMPDGSRGQPGSVVPPEWRKRPEAGKPKERRQRVPQSMDEMSTRWTVLMDKQGHGVLTPDEEREAADLEAQIRRMRAGGGMENAA